MFGVGGRWSNKREKYVLLRYRAVTRPINVVEKIVWCGSLKQISDVGVIPSAPQSTRAWEEGGITAQEWFWMQKLKRLPGRVKVLRQTFWFFAAYRRDNVFE